jgi:hypothetical protein
LGSNFHVGSKCTVKVTVITEHSTVFTSFLQNTSQCSLPIYRTQHSVHCLFTEHRTMFTVCLQNTAQCSLSVYRTQHNVYCLFTENNTVFTACLQSTSQCSLPHSCSRYQYVIRCLLNN